MYKNRLTVDDKYAIKKAYRLNKQGVTGLIVKTRLFEKEHSRFKNLSEMAKAMGISISQIYRVREGKRGINQSFIIGAMRAFPERRLDDLFYLSAEDQDDEAEYKS